MSKRVRDCVSLARFVIALAYQTGVITLNVRSDKNLTAGSHPVSKYAADELARSGMGEFVHYDDTIDFE